MSAAASPEHSEGKNSVAENMFAMKAVCDASAGKAAGIGHSPATHANACWSAQASGWTLHPERPDSIYPCAASSKLEPLNTFGYDCHRGVHMPSMNRHMHA